MTATNSVITVFGCNQVLDLGAHIHQASSRSVCQCVVSEELVTLDGTVACVIDCGWHVVRKGSHSDTQLH